MQRFVLCVAVLLMTVACSGRRHDDPPTIDYRGEKIPISRNYPDYEAYEDDPDNLPPASAKRAATMIQEAKLPDVYSSNEEMTAAMFALKFPGYGLTAAGARPQADGTVLELFAIELPKAERERFIVYRGRDGRFELMDDFVESWDRAIIRVDLEGAELVYRNGRDEVVLKRPPRKTGP